MIIFVTSKFRKAYGCLPELVRKKAKDRENIFRKNPFSPQLETHRLHGKYKEYSAFSVDGDYRIMLQFLDAAKTKAVFINIGAHNIYK